MTHEKHYNYFRDYDPAIGRYVESDPIGLGRGINTYNYSHSSPLVRGDRLGQYERHASPGRNRRVVLLCLLMVVVAIVATVLTPPK